MISTSAALGTALAAVEVAYAEPPRARRLAAAALAAAGGDPEPAAVAQRALGMARVAVGDLDAAETHLRTAVGLADGAGLADRAAEARASLSYLLALGGRTADALAELDRAAAVLRGVTGARLRMQRALVLSEAGRFAEAASGYDAALRALSEAGGDPVVEADLRNNRALLAVQRRDWPVALSDLARAEVLYAAAGQDGKLATVHHNRGLALAAQGDLPAALAAFDEAAARYRGSGRDPGLLAVERADALLSVLLVAEARAAAEEAVAQFTAQRNAVDLVQARLVLARAALLGGDLAVAAAQADRARRAALAQQRPGWAALGGYLALRARWEGGRRDEATVRAGRRAVAALSAAGWAVEAMDARLIVARTALTLGRPRAARRALADVPSGAGDPAELRARVCHARALLRLSEGDGAGAGAALRDGMAVLDRFRASLGATELRVHAAGHAGELAALGLRLALASGDPPSVFEWGERWRAGALMLRPARPDPALAADLAELRQVVASRSLDRQVELEESIRRRSHRAAPSGPALGSPVPAAALRAALGSATLVEYLAVDGVLHAVVLGPATTLHRLGPLAPVERDLVALRYGLRRLVGAASPDAAAALVAAKAAALDAALLGPLSLGDGPLVLVPTGVLHSLPWGALPSCAARPVSVAPSATLWHRAATASSRPGRSVLVAGPDLEHAAAEVDELTQPGAEKLTGPAATADAVTRALDGAELAHIAAHGHFRADNPLFSALSMVDGPLTVHDLERLSRPPSRVVLSSCESGLAAVHPGDELLGLSAALLAIGVRSLVASVLPVPDEAARPVMVSLHRHLRSGAPPAAALARARSEFPAGAAWVAAAGFLCWGAG
ncbi:MAG TPA: CHAT domain-containing protein [Mycobacteriales bacterium]|nr:CHAT domain-containing protein [Mycobacteriales bacterium]